MSTNDKIPTVARRLSDGTIIELLFDPSSSTTAFAIMAPGADHMSRATNITLAVHPSSHGFGWIAFTSPFTVYDWGSCGARAKHLKNEACLRKLEKLIDRLEPSTLVLEAFEPERSSRCTRITRLCRAIVALAASRNIDVAIYPFAQVRGCFRHLGAQSRDEIAAAVGRLVPALSRVVPPVRQRWDTEHWRMSLMSAAAIALTHYQLGADALLDSLSD